MRDVTFAVQPSLQQTAQETGTRNVHAYARGKMIKTAVDIPCERRVTYRPFDETTPDDFIYADSGEKAQPTSVAKVTPNGVFVPGEESVPSDGSID